MFPLFGISCGDWGNEDGNQEAFSPDEEMSVEETLPEMRDLHLEPEKKLFIVILVSLLELNDLEGNVSKFLKKVPTFRDSGI